MKNLCEILIVDSYPEYYDSFCDEIKKHSNYSILRANYGFKAIEIINKCSPKFIIIDWELPDMTGLELISLFKEKAIKLDVLTVMTCPHDITPDYFAQSIEAGSFSLMKKPLNNIASLAERTHQFLDKINSREAIITITHEELTKKDLSILQSQNIIESVSKKLTTLYDAISFENFTARQLAIQLKKEIDELQAANKTARFDITSNKLHPNFEKNLTSYITGLTGSEIRLCSLIRLGLDIKEISSVLNVTPESVKVSRSRLRKKLGLETSQNLKGFLAAF